MKQHFWNKRIPTFLGVVLIAIGLAVTTFLVKQGGLLSINANPSTQPENVRLTNITDSSFTVSYETSDSTFGVISYGQTSSLGQSGLDDRDQNSGNIVAHKIHNITVRNLSPLTKYYFSIISGKDTYLNNNSPYEITTGKQINDQPTDQEPAGGTVVLEGGGAPKEAIIYLTTDNSQVISTLTKEDGTFILPLNSLRNSDFSQYFQFNDETILRVLAIGEGKSSNVVLSILQAKPIPTITLSNNYDFTTTKPQSATNSGSLNSFPSFDSSQKENTSDQSPKILTPQKEQGFSDEQPQFKGTALANETVQITIHSDENIQATVKADSSGNWTYRPDKSLSPGNHTITIVAKDASGVSKTITQSFIVYASGTQLAGEAGSPTPTLKPTLTLTPTTEPTGNPTPTEVAELTPTVTLSPTPTEVSQLSPTPSPPLPPTGNPTIITLGLVGLAITLLGSLLFLFSRKAFI